MHNARHIAAAENVSEYDLEILLTAALFHDTGFLETYKDHEEISCGFAKQYLPNYEYTNEEIEWICDLIRATKIPQKANNKLEQILCDADVAYLGTENIFSVSKTI